MRTIPSILDPVIVEQIDARLERVADEHDVRIAWAIESGSRAWGFPSPDSDYDCRFLFIRQTDAYSSLWPQRDVIETPLDRIFDVNGWDLAKAIRLIVKGNATPAEWLRSPIVYAGDEGLRDRLLEFAEVAAPRSAVVRHYVHVGEQQLSAGRTLKRFFYALRPAAALRWLREHPDAAVPPMDLPTLLAETDVRHDVREAVDALIAAKAVTHELGVGTPPDILIRFADEEFALARAVPDEAVDSDRVRRLADSVFRAELAR